MTKSDLLTPDRSGLYRKPADANALRQAAGATGLAWIEVDLSSVQGKTALLRTLADALRFPASFGHNWDALADSLQDLSWSSARGHVLSITGVTRGAGSEWGTLREVLQETAAFWQAHHQAFVVLADDLQLPEWR